MDFSLSSNGTRDNDDGKELSMSFVYGATNDKVISLLWLKR